LEIYRDLGRIANKGADFLRRRGFSAHAGHPLMGMALYPPLAQAAGLGWLAANGLIVTPEHGPRVRLAAIFTGAENLPFSTRNDHAWVADFCQNCLLCVKKCPPQGIRSEPIHGGNGQISYVISERCFPYFSDHFGCSVCIAVCPFNQVPYDTLKEKHEVRNGWVVG
jgi:epoxyqueuosine reductase QueG